GYADLYRGDPEQMAGHDPILGVSITMTCQYFPWCPSCRTTECFDLFDENPFLPPSGFWSYKETNWPSETPAFDAEWNFNAGRVEFSNKGAFTRVFDTQDPMASYSLAMFEAQFVTNSLTSGS